MENLLIWAPSDIENSLSKPQCWKSYKIETAQKEHGWEEDKESQDLTQQLESLFEGLISRWDLWEIMAA